MLSIICCKSPVLTADGIGPLWDSIDLLKDVTVTKKLVELIFECLTML